MAREGLPRKSRIEDCAMNEIFVVEDDAIICEDLRRTLERLNYSVGGTARSGVEAVLAIEERRPDLILMDIKLGGRMDGIQTTAAIRKRWNLPVIYLTSHSDDATLARAKETGPHGYLLKPFNERDLRTAIEVALRKHELEVKLLERERWFATTLESVGDAVVATDRAGHITFMNAVAEQVTGWTRQDAQGKMITDVLKVVDANGRPLSAAVGQASEDEFKVELPTGARLQDRSGTPKEVDDSVAPILDERGNVLGSVVVFRDITKRKRLEQRLAASERLASISTMAAGMAHEINTPLAGTLGNLEFALRRLESIQDEIKGLVPGGSVHQAVAEAIEALSDANRAGARVRSIVNDLKKFSKADDAVRELVDLPDVVDAALKLALAEGGPQTKVALTLGTTPLVAANEGRLAQALANLLINAAQAGSSRIEVATHTNDAGRAVVEVRDDGPGILPEVLPKIFDPFFTTKPVGTGLGLGLSICHTVVTALGGEIAVHTFPGGGTTFAVTLPAATEPRPKARIPSLVPAPGRRGRVLLIDDDTSMAKVVPRLLRDLHDVEAELDARDALARLQRGEAFDVILCDLTMPYMTGVEVFEAVFALSPALAARIVFLTGGVLSAEAGAFLDECANLVIYKPFSMNRLRAVVASYVR